MHRVLSIIPFLAVFTGSAFACSCSLGTNHASRAMNDVEKADVIFEGVLLDVQRREMKTCVPGHSNANWTFPKGLVKVTRALKGVHMDALVVVEFRNTTPSGWDENCDVNGSVGVNSCMSIFDPTRIELPGEERWWIGNQDSSDAPVQLFDGYCGPSFYRYADEIYPEGVEAERVLDYHSKKEGAGNNSSGKVE